MKIRANEELSERDKLILDAIVSDYIGSPEPVGSRTISRKCNLNISPATIRNVASDLEELGYLTQPHSSSGRIPTDKGFRFYVDRLLHLQKLTDSQKSAINKKYDLKELGLKGVLEETSKVLSELSKYVGLVLAPKLSVSLFEHIEFIKLSNTNILVVFATKTGLVYNKAIRMTEPIIQNDLQRVSNYLNEIMQGLNLYEIRKKIMEEMNTEQIKCNLLFSRALNIFKNVVEDGESEENIYIGGTSGIINDPIFKDVTEIKRLLKAFEDKKLLIKILDKSIEEEGTAVLIGAENDSSELVNCSVVSSSYGKDSVNLGTLGVIGPRRMDYAHVIPLVDYMSQLVSRLMEFIN